VGLAVGVPALRLQGIYLALATIAFVEVLRVFALNLPVAGGAVGIFGIPQVFDAPLGYAWVAGPLLLVACAFTMRLEKTRVGRSLTAVREDELAAASVGINAPRSKLTAFVLGAVLAGLTGAMSAHFLNTWNSRQGTFDVSIAVLAFVLIGGSRTWLGPVLGGVGLTALPEILRASADVGQLPAWMGDLLRDGRLIIYGLLLAAGCLFFPRGLVTPELYAFVGRCVRQFLNRPTEEDEQMAEAGKRTASAAAPSVAGGAK
jgi:branched-chain amino acid transport system permease protein